MGHNVTVSAEIVLVCSGILKPIERPAEVPSVVRAGPYSTPKFAHVKAESWPQDIDDRPAFLAEKFIL